MNVTTGAKTDPGRRANNEDCHVVIDTRQHGLRADSVLVIADGMGGRNFGERAASVAVETIQSALIEMLSDSQAEGVPVGDALASALRKANARVYDIAHADRENHGMGTTCVVAVIESGLESGRLYVAHAGDSRAYLLRDGHLEQLTHDHSYVAEQVRAGGLTEEGARRSRFRNVITRAVGIEPTISPDVAEYDLRPADAILLCTDGLTNAVPQEGIAQTLADSPSAQAAAERLVQQANKNGARDNITAVVARVGVGNRTLRLRVEDLAPAGAADKEQAPKKPRRSLLTVSILSLLALALLASTLYFAHLLTRAGYKWSAAPPFAIRPASPTINLPNLDAVAYDAPGLFSDIPVWSDLLTRDPKDGSLVVASQSDMIVRLGADGRVLSKTPWSSGPKAAPVPAPGTTRIPYQPSVDSAQHFAADTQGNLYVADAYAKTITKYDAAGRQLGSVAPGLLTLPGALAVADDGTIFVIDAERLKVIRAHATGKAH